MDSCCITLGRSDLLALRRFCRRHSVRWFLGKGKGAYIGARTQKQGMLYYFRDCDPRSKEWRWTAEKLFGRTSFTEYLPADWLDAVAKDPTVVKVHINVYPKNINAEFIRL